MIDTHKLNPRDCIVMMPSCCTSDACRQGRRSCPTPQACRLAEGEQVSFDDRPRDWTAAWGIGAIALTAAWAAFLLWIIARIA
jgi:hypothetical protein